MLKNRKTVNGHQGQGYVRPLLRK
uniref:Uncharacterized protein n=1 Tax=Neospora caninum (strain Liverpool) TaxID=572307 RepID=F0JB11_NEOCL|nr:hypothetical protein NCLIV_069340 [Neospora caninum Liverpool]CEL71277.1 TPA: hypothetical protein BN1204_069340 [Neospora caninum Liverpool]